MGEFNDFIQSMELVSVSLLGNKFTWFNLEKSACSPLDRFLISKGLLYLLKVKGLVMGDRTISDHCLFGCKVINIIGARNLSNCLNVGLIIRDSFHFWMMFLNHWQFMGRHAMFLKRT